MTPSRLSAFLLLVLANLLWSGNWIAGRALRDAFDPITLNFSRWVIAALVLAPFALPALRGKGPLLRQHLGILLLLSLTGIAVFHALVKRRCELQCGDQCTATRTGLTAETGVEKISIR